jgi:hypothetical protein
LKTAALRAAEAGTMAEAGLPAAEAGTMAEAGLPAAGAKMVVVVVVVVVVRLPAAGALDKDKESKAPGDNYVANWRRDGDRN